MKSSLELLNLMKTEKRPLVGTVTHINEGEGHGERVLIVARHAFGHSEFEVVPLKQSEDWGVHYFKLREGSMNGWPWKPYLRSNGISPVSGVRSGAVIRGVLLLEDIVTFSEAGLTSEDEAEAQASFERFKELHEQRKSEQKRVEKLRKLQHRALTEILDEAPMLVPSTFEADSLLQLSRKDSIEKVSETIDALTKALAYLKENETSG